MLAIVPITEAHIEGYHAALDEVAREHAYLAMAGAPPLERSRAFVQDNIARRHPHVVAVDDGRVVGWCDVTPRRPDAPRECGILGIGLLAPYRGRGHGRALMDAAIGAARAAGLVRIELTVHAHNERAVALYRRVGFAGGQGTGHDRVATEFLVMSYDL